MVVEYLGPLDPSGVSVRFHDSDDAAVDMAANAVGVGLTLAVGWTVTERPFRGSER